ncbi:hypothetical protein KXJ74_00395 [Acinetobacter johnsonii]|nr:hypothetical protein KXJ74_00395 [Acinetobacter johnsonii]
MKVAIHHRGGSFSDYWIKYCQENNFDYEIVSAFDTNIIEKIRDFDVFVWHYHHANFKDSITAQKILFSLEHAGIKVFPDFKTGWHFDDKVAQKYLLESFKAPLVPSYVFYCKKEAIEWLGSTSFPKVFKLKGGAGGSNVILVKNFKDAKKIVSKAFGKGFSLFNKLDNLKESYRNVKVGNKPFIDLIKAIYRMVFIPKNMKNIPNEKGYVYFQEFIPNNKTDFRIKVVGDKCWGFQRKVRDNDFRASGSGNLIFDYQMIPIDMIKIAFKITEELGLQSVAYDFVIDDKGQPLIVEMCYGFGIDERELSYGYWNKKLEWIISSFDPRYLIIDEIIKGKNTK